MADVCILKTDGTNCDAETAYAVELEKGTPQIVHVNEFRSGSRHFRDFGALIIPGGFSYGDDVASGRVLANELIAFFKDQLREFIGLERPILGICNGFQVLVRAGILPSCTLGSMEVTLAFNDTALFEHRWVELVPGGAGCMFTAGITRPIMLAAAHGEGRVDMTSEMLESVKRNDQVVFRYAENGRPTEKYPANPNASLWAIAALCDSTGLILGMMPHPERFVDETQHPNWRRMRVEKPHGRLIFENLTRFIN